MKKKRYIFVLVMTLCFSGLFFWYTSFAGSVATHEQQEKEQLHPRPVPTAVVEHVSGEHVRMFPGTVKSSEKVDISFSVGGLLTTLNGRQGHRLDKGDVIAVMDQRDFKHSLDVAEANFANVKKEMDRVSSLRQKNVISQAEYDRVKMNYDVASAELEIRRKALEDTVLRAPFKGVVAKRYVENREHVKKLAPVVAIKNIDDLEVEIEVPETLMTATGMKPFKKIEVEYDIDSGQYYPASMREYSLEVDPVTRTYTVAVSMEKPVHMEVLPGMTATVRITFADAADTATQAAAGKVPVEAVFSESDGRSYVWVIPEDGGKPKKRAVVLGALRNTSIEIRRGLSPDMLVATAGVHTLREDMLVRPMISGEEGLDG